MVMKLEGKYLLAEQANEHSCHSSMRCSSGRFLTALLLLSFCVYALHLQFSNIILSKDTESGLTRMGCCKISFVICRGIISLFRRTDVCANIMSRL
jgi:hypothetical protein